MKINVRIWSIRLVALSLAALTLTSTAPRLGVDAAEVTEQQAEYQPDLSIQPATDDERKELMAMAGTVDDDLNHMELVAETHSLALYFNRETTEIALKEKLNGSVWYSNPIHRESASGTKKMNSQFTITYYSTANQSNQFENYQDSVAHQQFEIMKIDNGIKIVYTLGDNSKGIEVIPRFISENRFNEAILNQIKDDKAKTDIMKRFKLLKDQGIYERRDAALTDVSLKRTIKLFEEIGYDEEQLAIDNNENGIESEAGKGKPVFTIPLEYRLDGDSLVVNVPVAEVKKPKAYPLSSIALLEYFGAANDNEEGYMLVPDGAGSLIYLNNGKSGFTPFNAKVYGKDNAQVQTAKAQFDETIRLPVFGMKKAEKAFFAIIENGDALARIEADVSGRLDSYNRVFSSYTITAKDETTLQGGYKTNTIPVFEEKPYEGDITVRYSFLDGDFANYSGMASYYRNYLVQKHQLTKLKETSDLPFYLELIGAATKQKSFLGIPYQSLQSLTTFKQAETIVEELQDAGINHINLRYTGWFNKGINHRIPTTVSPDRILGGKSGFQSLIEFADANDIKLYPDVAFLNVYQSTNGFRPKRDASRFITRRTVKLQPYDPATYLNNALKSEYYVLSPGKLDAYTSKFLKGYMPYGNRGLSLRDLGNEVNADYREGSVIGRQEANGIFQEQAKKLTQSVPDLLIAGGNVGELPYASSIVNAPLTNSSFNITDTSVPFYEMVVHGYIDYAGKPLNLADDQDLKKNMLKLLETGSNVIYTWIFEDSSLTKNTEFDHYYALNYKEWIEEAKVMYDEINQTLRDVRSKTIVRHEILADQVVQTTYEGGKAIIVNYGRQPFSYKGITIGAESYWAGEEKS